MISNGDACPACRSNLIKTGSYAASDSKDGVHISVIECTTCGLGWQFPLLRTIEQSATYFFAEYEAAEKNTYFDRANKRKIAELQLEFIRSVAPTPGRLLDIGAGDGTFISAAADKDWHSTGLDPASHSFSYAPTGLGSARLLHGDFSLIADADPYDVITLWDVIEHVEQPLELIRSAVSLLSEDGVAVIETGNFQSADRIEGEENWWCYQADHRWYFSPSTLLPLLKEVGLHYVVLAPRVFRPWWKGTAAFRRPSAFAAAKKIVRQPLAPLSPIRQYLRLLHGASQWAQSGGLGIFAVAASRRPICEGSEADFIKLA
jgi:2-polyprenyl-3-methyl-5-hydroxy-6-metoxy-1,4-benzoquinol methylase